MAVKLTGLHAGAGSCDDVSVVAVGDPAAQTAAGLAATANTTMPATARVASQILAAGNLPMSRLVFRC